jgi:hypothetical protein
MLPDRFVYEGLEEQVLLEILASQEKLMAEDDYTINPTLGIVIEDCVDSAFRWKTDVERVFYAGRYITRRRN